MFDTPDFATKRSRDERPKRLIKIQISNDRIRTVDAILRNVTDMGAGIELQTQLLKGEKVSITIKNLEPLMCTVVWSEDQQAGLSFNELVDPSALTVRNIPQVKGEGIFNDVDGYHVFNRFNPMSGIKRPALKAHR